jgi:sigma-E factor negative regulatory protein RseB
LTVNGMSIWRRGLFLVLASAALLVPTSAMAASCPAADSEAMAWLDKMSRGLQQASYHGVITFQRGDDLQAMQVSHSVVDGVATERLTELTGQGAEIVRVDHPLECLHPGHQLLQVGAQLQAGQCGVAEYYRFSVVTGELVAGRQSIRIHIEPRDMYRYGYVMQLDQDTGLLLKSETIGRGDKVLEKFQFASLTYAPGAAAVGGNRVVHQAQHPHLEDRQLSIGSVGLPWRIDWLPLGFTNTDNPNASGERKTYTDGLAVFSVFLELLSGEIRPGEGVVRTGGTTSYTRGMHLGGHSVLVTVIGEVPLNTARMVADSISMCAGAC